MAKNFLNRISLKNLNNYASILHAISAVVVVLIFYLKGQPANFDTNFYTPKVVELSSDSRSVKLEVKKVADNPTRVLETVIAAIFLITSLFHIFYATNGFGSGSYERDLSNSYNRWRWLEYGITSTLMIYIFLILSGVKDVDAAATLCLINAVLMSIGYYLEQMPRKENKIVALVVGFAVVIGIFSIIFRNFFSRVDEVKNVPDPVDLPSWLYGVLIPMFFWWISFGIVAVLNVRAMDKPGYDFKRYERYYIYLSFLSKAFMGYYLAYGFSRDPPDRQKTTALIN